MTITKDNVLNKLGISDLPELIQNNILELCELNILVGTDNLYDYDSVYCVYSEAATFFTEYLPEYYVSTLLQVSVNDLLNMNIEYRPIPAEMQAVFFDFYPKGTFKYSYYAYNVLILGLLVFYNKFGKDNFGKYIFNYAQNTSLTNSWTKFCPKWLINSNYLYLKN
jgi:hypothetical protein